MNSIPLVRNTKSILGEHLISSKRRAHIIICIGIELYARSYELTGSRIVSLRMRVAQLMDEIFWLFFRLMLLSDAFDGKLLFTEHVERIQPSDLTTTTMSSNQNFLFSIRRISFWLILNSNIVTRLSLHFKGYKSIFCMCAKSNFKLLDNVRVTLYCFLIT